jgi:Family of unknown function (DUF5723)
MSKIRLILLLLILFLSGAGSLYAQPMSLYFLKGVPQTKDLNPSRPGLEKGFYVSLPLLSKLDLSLNANNWSFNDLIHRGTGTMADSLVWDFKKYLSALDKNNFVMESAALTLVEMGWKRKTSFYGFSWSEHEFAEPFFTKSLANILYYGNVPYLGSTYQSGYFGLGAQHYREFAFTYSRDLVARLSFGVTGKLLFGMGTVSTSGMNVVAGMPIDGNQINLGATGKAYVSAPINLHVNNTNGIHLLSQSYFDANSYFSNFGNPGFAVDLGFTNKLNKRVTFSVSLIDLGFIRWKTNLSAYTENGHFVYRGINLNSISNTTDVHGLFTALRDSLTASFLPDSAASSFTTMLPVKLYAALEYKVGDDFSLGGVTRIRMYNNLLHASLTASANARLSETLSLSASYSMVESTYDNLGLAASFRFGKVQLYAVSDNVVSFLQPSSAHNMNVRVGINLIFQEDAQQRKGTYDGKERRSRRGHSH